MKGILENSTKKCIIQSKIWTGQSGRMPPISLKDVFQMGRKRRCHDSAFRARRPLTGYKIIAQLTCE